MKKILLTVFSLVLLFSFTSQASDFTWVKLGDFEIGTVWYDPATIEKGEEVGSALIKVYYPETNDYIMVWMIIECEAKKYYLAGALLVDENDKALEFKDGEVEGGIIFGSDSAAEQLYHLLCPKAVKKEVSC